MLDLTPALNSLVESGRLARAVLPGMLLEQIWSGRPYRYRTNHEKWIVGRLVTEDPVTGAGLLLLLREASGMPSLAPQQVLDNPPIWRVPLDLGGVSKACVNDEVEVITWALKVLADYYSTPRS